MERRYEANHKFIVCTITIFPMWHSGDGTTEGTENTEEEIDTSFGFRGRGIGFRQRKNERKTKRKTKRKSSRVSARAARSHEPDAIKVRNSTLLGKDAIRG
jgi:hypothetical protein